MALKAQYPNPSSGWQPYQALITRLYRDEDRPLKEVMQIMQCQHGFKATEKMYKSRFKAWGLDKNNKRNEVMEILRWRDARKSVGKKSHFVLRGRPVDIADVERYARRIGLTESSIRSSSPRPIQNLFRFTTPSTPPPIDAPTSLQNIERFLFFYNTFLEDSLQSGFWRQDKQILGFSSVHGSGYPMSARNGFLSSVERGVQRYRCAEISQAYRQWRRAFGQLQSLVQSRKPSQLICLVENLASLAHYQDEVAIRLLQYMGSLVHSEHTPADTGLAMLQSLSRLEAKDLYEVDRICRHRSWITFRAHFSVDCFFLADSETILMDSNKPADTEIILPDSELNKLISTADIYDHGSLRGSRAVIELLMESQQYSQAKRFALKQIQQMRRLPTNKVLLGAICHLYNHLVHIYLSRDEYEKAYQIMVDQVEAYFELLIYDTDLPEDFVLTRYSQLGSLAHELGNKMDAGKWEREHTILKTRIDGLAEKEVSQMQTTNSDNTAHQRESIDLENPPSRLSPEAPLEIVEGTVGSRPRYCRGHVSKEVITVQHTPLRVPSRRPVVSGYRRRSGSAEPNRSSGPDNYQQARTAEAPAWDSYRDRGMASADSEYSLGVWDSGPCYGTSGSYGWR